MSPLARFLATVTAAVLLAGCGAGALQPVVEDPYGAYAGSEYTDPYGEASPGAYDDYGVALPSPSPTPTADVTFEDPNVLHAWVVNAKPTGFAGLGGVTARVEVKNPSTRQLTGRLRVAFTSGGAPTADVQSRRVTLRPTEVQYLTFSAKGFRIDGAEATVETELVPAASTGGSTVQIN